MQWEVIVALVLAIPIVLFPVAFIVWLNVGWVFTRRAEATEKKMATRREMAGSAVRADK